MIILIVIRECIWAQTKETTALPIYLKKLLRTVEEVDLAFIAGKLAFLLELVGVVGR